MNSRQYFQDGMEVIFQDFNNLQARSERGLFDSLIFELIQKTENAFFGDSHKVNFASPTSVTVLAGIGFQTDATAVAPEPTKKLMNIVTNEVLSIIAPDTVNDRIDIVVAKWSLVDGSTEDRKFKNATDLTITSENLVVEKIWKSELMIINGTPAATPTAPALPAGYLQLATLNIAAVNGMTDQTSIVDDRALMPLGSMATINSSAFGNLTMDPELSLQDAFSEVDQLLINGCPLTNTYKPVTAVPPAPLVSGERTVYNLNGQLFVRESGPEGGAVSPLGSGAGGGGGGAEWIGDAAEDIEFAQNVFKFSENTAQKLTVFMKVPQGYIPGRQIVSNLGFYSTSAAGDFKMQTTAALIRKGQDTVDSMANTHVSDSGDIINDTANEFRQLSFELSNATGQFNGFSASPGDLLKIELTRAASTNGDAADIRFIPATTEVLFG